MSPLARLLQRLRRLSMPPGGAARALAVPAAGEELTDEVRFLFGELDALERAVTRRIAEARAQAAAIEADAAEQRRRLLAEARRDGERLAAELLQARRGERTDLVAAIEERGRAEAAGILERGHERLPAFVELARSWLLAPPETLDRMEAP